MHNPVNNWQTSIDKFDEVDGIINIRFLIFNSTVDFSPGELSSWLIRQCTEPKLKKELFRIFILLIIYKKKVQILIKLSI